MAYVIVHTKQGDRIHCEDVPYTFSDLEIENWQNSNGVSMVKKNGFMHMVTRTGDHVVIPYDNIAFLQLVLQAQT